MIRYDADGLSANSPDRVEFSGALTREGVRRIVGDSRVKVLQCSSSMSPRIWSLLDSECFARRHDVSLRIYRVPEPCDLGFLEGMSNVRHLVADCLYDGAVNVHSIGRLSGLESLVLEVRGLQDLSVLDLIPPDLKMLSVAELPAQETLERLARFSLLKDLQVGGSGRMFDLGPVAGLRELERLELRECRVRGLECLQGLQELWWLGFSLCDVRSLEGLRAILWLKHLEVFRAPKLEDLGALESMVGLQCLDHSELRKVTVLPTLRKLESLRLIKLGGMKNLGGLSELEWASALLNLEWMSPPKQLLPEMFVPLLRNPVVKGVWVELSNKTRQRELQALCDNHGVELKPARREFQYK